MMNKGINSPTNLTNDRHQNPEHDNLHCEIYHEGPNLEKLVVGYSFFVVPMLSNHSNAWRVSNRSVQNYVQQVCIPVGCVPPTCWHRIPWYLRGGVYLGVCIPACNEADPPWTEWLTDRCKKITLHQTSFAGGKKFRWLLSPAQDGLPRFTWVQHLLTARQPT